MPPNRPDESDSQFLDDLVARCIAALEAEGPEAVDRICAENVDLAERIRARLARLGHHDLLHPPRAEGTESSILEPGRQLGPYRIEASLGAGAMGQVYRARDSRLDRDVAVKVLPTDFAADAERLVRFEREARSLAALNHSNIAQIYSVDQVDGIHFLTLEYVPGETLNERLARHRLRVEDALRICRDVAEGLESAHEAGVVHRDLKPANIRVTPDGTAKVLDFGLAKSVQQGLHDSVEDSSLQTRSGAVLGTPVYMSPEQIRAHPVDRRADIWAFGCLLYECLTGDRAFGGATFSDVAAAIVGGEANLDALPARTPEAVRHLIRRCLRKDPKERLRDIGDARVELEDVLAGRVETPDGPARSTGISYARLGVAVVLAAAAGMALSSTFASKPASEPGMTLSSVFASEPGASRPTSEIAQFSITLRPPTNALVLESQTGASPPLAISPDGKRIAFAARDTSGVKQVYERHVSSTELQPVDGSDLADFPVYSQDGQLLFATISSADLMRVTPDGSIEAIRHHRSSGVIRGISWDAAGRIVFANQDQGLGLMPPSRDSCEIVTEPGDDEVNHRWPQFLPDGRVLYTAHLSRDEGRLLPRILDLKTGKHVDLPDLNGSVARYLSDGRGDEMQGFIVYVRAGDMYAVRMDLHTTRTIGRPRPVLEGIHESQLGLPHFALAESSGALVYEPQRPPSAGRGLVWVNRKSGKAEPLRTGTDHAFEFPRLSPTQPWVLYANHNKMSMHECWFVDFGGATPLPTKIRTGYPNCVQPVWGPDGEGVIWGDFTGEQNMWIQRSLRDSAKSIKRRPGWQLAREWGDDGRVRFMEKSRDGVWSLYEIDISKGIRDDATVRELVVTRNEETAGTLSPNRKWYAYVSKEAGHHTVYVRRYTEKGELGPPISIAKGTEPLWSKDSKELFFRRRRTLFAVEIADTDGRPTGKPSELFEGDFLPGFNQIPFYDVTADGQRFVFVEGDRGITKGRLEIHLNFRAELEKALPK